MVSLVKNNANSNLDIYIIHDGLSSKKINKVLNLPVFKDCKISFIDAKANINYDKLPINNKFHLPKSTYFRFYIPEIIKDVDKLLYIDIDTLIMEPLDELFALPLNDHYFAAAPELGSHTLNYMGRLDLLNSEYYNCGILLLNLKKIRKDKFFNKVKESIDNFPYDIYYADQDILNVFTGCEYNRLPNKWNMFSNNYVPLIKESIVHLAGPDKYKLRHWESYRNSFIGSGYFDFSLWKKLLPIDANRLADFLFTTPSFKYFLKKFIKGILLKSSNIVRPEDDEPEFGCVKYKYLQKISEKIFPEQTVRYGMFANLNIKLPFNRDFNNIPYLLGLAYSELEPIIKILRQVDFRTINFLAYYEAYLLAGFEKLFPMAELNYFYMNNDERKYIHNLSKVNGFDDKINFDNRNACFYDTKTLKNSLYIINIIQHHEIVFDKTAMAFPPDSYILIKFTNQYKYTSIQWICDYLKDSHRLQFINSNFFVDEVVNCKYDEVAKFNIEIRNNLLMSDFENRCWIFATPNNI